MHLDEIRKASQPFIYQCLIASELINLHPLDSILINPVRQCSYLRTDYRTATSSIRAKPL